MWPWVWLQNKCDLPWKERVDLEVIGGNVQVKVIGFKKPDREELFIEAILFLTINALQQ